MTAPALAVSADDGGTVRWAGLPATRLFRLDVDGAELTDLVVDHLVVDDDGADVRGSLGGSAHRVRWTARRLAGASVWELALEVQAGPDQALTLRALDPCVLALGSGPWTARWFESSWGQEMRPRHQALEGPLSIGTRAGRSAHGAVPWVGLTGAVGLVVAPAWSGNWHVDLAAGRLTAGISPWRLEVTLEPGETLRAPSVVLALACDDETAATELTRAVGVDWIPRSPWSDALPVEWNSWWPYEDADVDAGSVVRNARLAGRLGIQVCTLDAGWFGRPDPASDWQAERGDWSHVNTARFPNGVTGVADDVRAAGPQFGLWAEVEAVGAEARLRQEHPDLVASAPGRTRGQGYQPITVSLDPSDPGFLGYVCLGSPAGRDHARRTLDDLATATGARWLKIDFNIDPDAGCTRTDHGHGHGDGLLRHYQGLYDVLDEFRAGHPDVLVEGCASGGLRFDLGLARHVHCLYLSDPDYLEHHLQVLWGASLLLPPAALLAFSWSWWRGDYAPQRLDFTTLTEAGFDATIHVAMLHRLGFSLPLDRLTETQRLRLGALVDTYRSRIAPLVRDGVLTRLTAQPLREGSGERSPAFRLSHGESHLVVAYRLSGAEADPRPALVGLDPTRTYRVLDLASGASSTASGAALAVSVPLAVDRTSWLVLVEAC